VRNLLKKDNKVLKMNKSFLINGNVTLDWQNKRLCDSKLKIISIYLFLSINNEILLFQMRKNIICIKVSE
jgi:hypothetical protein